MKTLMRCRAVTQVIASVFSLTLASCALLAPSGNTADGVPAQSFEARAAETARLNQWLDARYEEQLQFSPMELTMLGRKELYDQIDDMTEAAAERELAWGERTVADLKAAFDFEALSPEGQASYQAWAFSWQDRRAANAFRRHQYVFSQTGGLYSFAPNFLINFHAVDSAADMRAYIARIAGLARGLDQQLERAQLAAADGIRAPLFAYNSVIDQATRVITGQPFDNGPESSAIWQDIRTELEQLLASGKISKAERDELQASALTALLDSWLPSYQRMIAWLKADKAHLQRSEHTALDLPNGAAFYQERLAHMTTLPLTAEQVHQIGLAEVARIRGEMEAIRERVGFAGDLEAFFVFLREDPQFFYPNTDAGRQGYLKDSAALFEALEDKLPRYFGLLPKARLEVKRVEAYRERPGGAQHYYPGTPDGSRPGVYYAHLADMRAYSKTDMVTTAYHEGLPGHHMQIAIAQERDDLPKFRTQAFFTAYTEGWALYAEHLAVEMGAFPDVYTRMGQLTAEMWRAIRLVVDTGMHAKGWSQEQAVAYFLKNSAIPETAVRSEVQRYLVTPGQATAYKIGMLQILAMRAEAEKILGTDFDIRGFHDAILGGGALPIPLLRQRVRQWVETLRHAESVSP